MSAIGNDAAPELTLGLEWSEDDAAEELLRGFLPEDGADASKKKPAAEKAKDTEKPEPETDEDDEASAEEPEDEGDDGAAEGDDEEAEKKYADDEGAYVKIKIDDEEHEVPVKELKRLYGQEKALTQKSMAVAEQRKTVEADLQRQTASSAALLARARERFEPYSKLDFHLLAAQLPAEDYTALRQSAQAAYEDVQFLEQHQDGFMKAIGERQKTELREKAIESLKILSGPTEKGGIEGWTEKLYDDIRAHAVAKGAPAEVINQLTDDWAIRLIHDAMLYQRGKVKSDGKSTVTVKKINKSPKRIVKTSRTEASEKGDSTRADNSKAMKKLRESGSPDDAAEALLARWKNSDD